MGNERVRLGLRDKEEGISVGDTEVRVRRKEGAVEAGYINHTAYHEACHALAALLVGVGLHKATDQPGDGYDGATWTGGYDRVVAAAAHAMGCRGTRHDMWTVRVMGDSPTAATAAAFALLAGRVSEINAIATEIQSQRVASGTQMAHARKRVREDTVEVTVRPKNGPERVETRTLTQNVVDVVLDRTSGA